MKRILVAVAFVIVLTQAVAQPQDRKVFPKLASEPKELYIVPRAGYVDLYDRVNLILFDKLESFFKANLK